MTLGTSWATDSWVVGTWEDLAWADLADRTYLSRINGHEIIGIDQVFRASEAYLLESDGTHLYWTNSAGTRIQLDN